MKILNGTLTLFCCVLLFTTSCKEDDALLDEIIRFENTAEETVPADNYTTLKIRVIIPKGADVSRRQVTFITDIGVFSNDSAQIKVQADNDGIADAYIRSNKNGKAKVTATVLTYIANKAVNFSPIDIAEAIRFDNFNPDPLEADNVTEKPIKILIDKNTPPAKRKVTVTTDIGTFTNQAATIDLLANDDGLAQTYLKSDVAGRAKIKAACNSFEAEFYLQIIPADPDHIIHFIESLPVSAPADGVSFIEIKAQTNSNVPADQRKVSFATDLGSFSSGNKTEEAIPGSTGVSRIVLKSSESGPAYVTATHKGVTQSKSFTFTRATPDRITLSADYSLKAGIANKLTIQALLTRLTGKPSRDFEIDYSVSPAIGLFRNKTFSNNNGQSQVDYSAGNTTFRGDIIITATVKEVPDINAIIVITITD